MMEPFFGERIWDLSFCADKIIFVKFLFNEYFWLLVYCVKLKQNKFGITSNS